MLYGKTNAQLIEGERVSDVVHKPSEARRKPKTSVKTPTVENELLSTIVALGGITLDPYTEHMGTAQL